MTVVGIVVFRRWKETTNVPPHLPYESVDYATKNRDLFTERATLLERVELLEQKKRLGVREKNELRAIRRRLEEVEVSILEGNKGLVMSYANRFTRKGRVQDQEDFEAAGTAGLVAAMKSYDPSRGSFAQWAYHPIQRAITRAVRDADFANLNPGDFERRPDILRARDQLAKEGQVVTYASIATVAGTTENQVRRVLAAPKLLSVDRPLGDGESTVGDIVADPSALSDDDIIAKLRVGALERHGMAGLDERECYVITRHFGLDGGECEKLATIGERLGLSREAARQIEGKALAKLGHPTVLRKLVRQRR